MCWMTVRISDFSLLQYCSARGRRTKCGGQRNCGVRAEESDVLCRDRIGIRIIEQEDMDIEADDRGVQAEGGRDVDPEEGRKCELASSHDPPLPSLPPSLTSSRLTTATARLLIAICDPPTIPSPACTVASCQC